MRLEEFVKYAEQYIEAITTVYKLVHSKEETLDEIVRFQNIAANALGPIDHILDIYADRRTQFGEGNREVDKFRESLTIYGMCGSGIIEYAIGEMKLVMAKLSRLQSVNPHL